MNKYFLNKQVFSILLLIILAGFLVLPKICFAEDFDDITLRETAKYLELPQKDAQKLIDSLRQVFTTEKISLWSSSYSTDEEIAVIEILLGTIKGEFINYLLIDVPVEITWKIIKGTIDIVRIYVDPSFGLEKLEKESVRKALEYGMKFLLGNEIRITSGAIKFGYSSYKGSEKEAIFQYIMMYKQLDTKSGKVEIRFYSPVSIKAPKPLAKGALVLQSNLPPFAVEIKGVVEKTQFDTFQWTKGPSVKIDFPPYVPDLGVKPLSRWERYLLKPIETTIKDVEVIITKVTGKSLGLVDVWEEFKKFISKIQSFVPAAIVEAPAIETAAQKPLTVKEAEGMISEIKEILRKEEKMEEEAVEVKPQLIEPKPKKLTWEGRLAEIQEMLDDIAERIDLMNQEVVKITGTEIIKGELVLKEIKEGEEGKEGEKEEKEKEEEEKEKEIKKEKIEPEEKITFCSINQSVTPQRNKVIVNEVAWMGTTNSANDEWIELKNISGSEISLNGWQLLDKEQQIKITFTTQLRVLNNGFWLLERTDDNSVPEVTADWIYTGGLKNSDEALYLFDENCQLQDEVLANPDWPAGDNSSKRTMERKNNLEWQTSLNPGGTPKSENSSGYIEIASYVRVSGGPSSPSYPKILISEIQIAGIESQKEEFVELYNPNDFNADLTDWYLQRKTKNATEFSTYAPKTLFSGKTIKAKDYFLIARQDSTFTTIADTITTYPLTENNSLVLKNPNRDIVDEVNWGEVPAGLSYGRVWSDINQEYLDNFEIQISTPKARNQKDTASPEIQITSKPPSLTNQTQATFIFQVNEENCSFGCKLDNQNWQSCQPPKEYQNLAAGLHTFSVRAIDLFLNESLPAEYTWTIDTSIESPTLALFDLSSSSQFYTNQREVGVTAFVTSEEEGISWFLSEENTTPTIDGTNWLAPKPEKFTLSAGDGPKTVYIWTKDLAQNISQLGNSASIILDTTPPTSQISQLESFQTSLSFTVFWSGNDLTSGILNYGVQYTTSPSDGVCIDWLVDTTQTQAEFTGEDGFAYYFRSRARDKANNLSEFSEITSTVIDVTPPEITLFSLPSLQTQLSFTLSWQGLDPIKTVTASGIDGFQLRYSENKESWTYFPSESEFTSEIQYTFTGQDGKSYYFQIKARDKAGNESEWTEKSTKIELPKDITPPVVSFVPLPEVQNSIFFTLSWTGEDPVGAVSPTGIDIFSLQYTVTPPLDGLKYLNQKGEWIDWLSSETLELPKEQNQIELEGQNGYQYLFNIKAIDKAGNESDPAQVSTKISLPKVLINEIQIDSLPGTGGANDDWVELYNPNNDDIDISSWSIQRSPSSGTLYKKNFEEGHIIPAKGYFLVVRNEANQDLLDLADMTCSALQLSSNHTVYLVRNQDWIESGNDPDIVDKVGFGQDAFSPENNPAPNPPEGKSIQRRELGKDTNDNSQDFIINESPTPTNSKGETRGATGPTNIANYQISENTLFSLQGSPYIIQNILTVSQGKTLIIEPGVVIKFDSDAYFTIQGTILAQGTPEQKIIFTSNNESPSVGDWGFLYFKNSLGSKLENIILEYGGKYYIRYPYAPNWTKGAIYVEGGEIEIKSSIIKDCYTRGLWLVNSSSIVENVEFSNIKDQPNYQATVALLIEGGNPVIKNSKFKGNTIGIKITGNATPQIKNNTFEENEIPIYLWGTSYPVFSGNTAQKNDLNGILTDGSTIVADTTWQADLPYIIDGAKSIRNNVTLTLEEGVVVKLKPDRYGYAAYLEINGRLMTEGTLTNPVLITSIYDDEFGGDTNNDGTETSPQKENWKFLRFYSSGSVLEGVRIRYGGGYCAYGDCWGAISQLADVEIKIKNSIIENNKWAIVSYQSTCQEAFEKITIDNPAQTFSNNDINVRLGDHYEVCEITP